MTWLWLECNKEIKGIEVDAKSFNLIVSEVSQYVLSLAYSQFNIIHFALDMECPEKDSMVTKVPPALLHTSRWCSSSTAVLRVPR